MNNTTFWSFNRLGLILSSLLVLSLFLPAHAQIQYYEFYPKFGIKVGGNYTLPYGERVIDKAGLPDFHAGLSLRFPITPTMAILSEALYSRKGIEVSQDLTGAATDVKMVFSYIEVPLLFSVDILPFTVHGGAYGAHLLNTDVTSALAGGMSGDVEPEDFNRFDYGVMVGGTFVAGRFDFGLRYSVGFRDIAKSEVTRILLGTTKHMTAQIT
ncbi:MAG: PorT family protein [Anaerolineales bacterium]|nr:PorT family protein [Anaerolineales bacterium]